MTAERSTSVVRADCYPIISGLQGGSDDSSAVKQTGGQTGVKVSTFFYANQARSMEALLDPFLSFSFA